MDADDEEIPSVSVDIERGADKLAAVFGSSDIDLSSDEDDGDVLADSVALIGSSEALSGKSAQKKKKKKKKKSVDYHGFEGVNTHTGYSDPFMELGADDYDYDSVHDSEAGKSRGPGGPASLKRLPVRQLYRLAKRQGRYLIFAMIALVISAGTNLTLPILVGSVIDIVINPDSHPGELPSAVGVMFLFVLVSSVASIFRRSLFEIAGERVVVDVRRDLFNAILQQEMAFFDRVRTGELVNRLASDATVLSNSVTVNLSMLLRFSSQFVFALFFLLKISWSLTLVLLSVLPFITLGAWVYGRFIRRLSKEVQDALAKAAETANEVIGEIRTVRSFSGEEREREKYFGFIDDTLKKYVKKAIGSGIFIGVSSLIAGIALCGIVWYGGSLVVNKTLSPGELTSFMMYCLTVVTALGALSSLFGDLMQAVGASERIFQLIGRRPRVRHRGGESLVNVKGELRFDAVQFAYPSRADVPVLQSLSFTAPVGKMIALVGPSGGGKTTCMSLLQGFYTADAGAIYIDGRDINSLDPAELRRTIGAVRQEPSLFACSIADNIRYGRPEASQSDVERASRLANCYDFIKDFPDGFDTMVGERGVRLSGGQKQRVAIARAIVLNPKILILDEATASLDAESEHLVKAALDNLMEGRTVVTIAHRLSTVMNADSIVVIRRGQKVEEGTHDQLMEANGIYKQLVARQLLADTEIEV